MRKAIGMFAALMVALAMTGVAFSAWSETLYINGTVNTGKLDVEIIAGTCSDSEPEGKNCSGISCEVVEGNTLKVTVTNAYPCINYTCEFKVKNVGTIPVHLYVTRLDQQPSPDVTVSVEDVNCKQVHPNEEVIGKVTVHVEQSAKQDSTYTFSFQILAIQWNKQPGQ